MPIAIAAGVLPDSDHLLDYYFKYVRQDRRFQFYLLHAWEYFITGTILYVLVFNEPWLFALLAGYATQLILDQLSHSRDNWPTAYFLTPRILSGFKAPPHKLRFKQNEYQSFIKSLPFGRGVAERWFRRRLEQNRAPQNKNERGR